jgi:hypothetical protein
MGCRARSSSVSLTTDWKTGLSRFDPWQRQEDFPLASCVQAGSGAHSASYPVGTGVPFPRGTLLFTDVI